MATYETQAVLDDARVRKFLNEIVGNAKKLNDRHRQAIGIISAIVYRDVMDHFDKARGPDGPWPKWSESYRDFMLKLGKGGNKLLIDTGRLRLSFAPSGKPLSRIVGDGIVFYNPAKTAKGFPYAAAHDTGGPKLPQRQFMWLSQEATDNMSNQLLQFLMGGKT